MRKVKIRCIKMDVPIVTALALGFVTILCYFVFCSKPRGRGNGTGRNNNVPTAGGGIGGAVGRGREGVAGTHVGKKEQVLSLPMAYGGKGADGKQAELLQRLKLTPAACVMTLSLPAHILKAIAAGTDEGLQVIDTISTLSQISNLFLIIQAVTDEAEKQHIDVLSTRLSFFPSHRILFHATTTGKIAIVRQIKPTIHLDEDVQVCNTVAPHLRSVVHVAQNVGGGGMVVVVLMQ